MNFFAPRRLVWIAAAVLVLFGLLEGSSADYSSCEDADHCGETDCADCCKQAGKLGGACEFPRARGGSGLSSKIDAICQCSDDSSTCEDAEHCGGTDCEDCCKKGGKSGGACEFPRARVAAAAGLSSKIDAICQCSNGSEECKKRNALKRHQRRTQTEKLRKSGEQKDL